MNLRLSAALSAVVIVLAGSGAAAINSAVLDNRGPLQSETAGLGVIAPSARPDVALNAEPTVEPSQPTNSAEPQPTDEPSSNPTVVPSGSPTPSSNFVCNDEEDDDEDDELEDESDESADEDFDEDNCGDD
jgi:hypothetical protein